MYKLNNVVIRGKQDKPEGFKDYRLTTQKGINRLGRYTICRNSRKTRGILKNEK